MPVIFAAPPVAGLPAWRARCTSAGWFNGIRGLVQMPDDAGLKRWLKAQTDMAEGLAPQEGTGAIELGLAATIPWSAGEYWMPKMRQYLADNKWRK